MYILSFVGRSGQSDFCPHTETGMSDRMKPILGALVAAYVINFAGVTYFFGPIMANDAPAGAMVSGWLSLAIVSVLLILFYDWVNQAVGSPVQSAMIVAVSQILLVDVFYFLNGTRGIAAAAASAVLLLVGWGVTGVVYGKLLDGQGAEATG
jgi:hypothetical protein